MTPDNNIQSLEDLLDALKQRFGSEGQCQKYRDLLRTRRRQEGESLADLYADISKLGQLAYADASCKLAEELITEAFCTSIGGELEEKIRDREPTSLTDAYRYAVRIEARQPQLKQTTLSYRRSEVQSACAESERDWSHQRVGHSDSHSARLNALEIKIDELERRELEESRQSYQDQGGGRFNQHVSCYNCGQYGHKYRQCSVPVQQQQLPQQVAQSFGCTTNIITEMKTHVVGYLGGPHLLCEFLLDTGSQKNLLPMSLCQNVALRPVNAKTHSIWLDRGRCPRRSNCANHAEWENLWSCLLGDKPHQYSRTWLWVYEGAQVQLDCGRRRSLGRGDVHTSRDKVCDKQMSEDGDAVQCTCTQYSYMYPRQTLSCTTRQSPVSNRSRWVTKEETDSKSGWCSFSHCVQSCSRPEREVVGRKEKERRRLAELQGRVVAERREAARVAAEEAKQAAQRRKEQRMKVTAACTDKNAGRSVRPAQQSREADRDLMTRKKFACYTVPVQEPCTAKSSEIPSAADEFGWSWLWESGGQDVVQDAWPTLFI